MRILKRALLALLVLVVVFAGWATYIATTSSDPKPAEGWTRLADLPRPRGEVAAAATAAPARFFVIGGLLGAGRTSRSVDVYDPVTDRWARAPDLPGQRHHPAAAAIGDTVFVSGGAGSSTNWRPQRNLWALKGGGARWQDVADMPEGRMGHQMVALGAKLYVVGGRGATSNVLIFDTVTSTWSTGAQMPVKRDHLGAALLGTKIYAIGGREASLLARVDVYDPVADAWSDGPALPIPMSAMAVGATTVPDRGIHVVGGEDPAAIGGGVIERHFFLADGSSAWVDAPRPVIYTHGAAAAVVGGRLHITAGAARQGALSPLAWRGTLQRYGG